MISKPFSFGKFALIFLFSSSCVPTSTAEKILFLLPMSSKSMANVFEPLAISLAERGHQLKIFSPVKFKIPESNKNVTQTTLFTPDDLFRDYPEPFEIRRKNKLFVFPLPFQQKYCNKLYDDPEFVKLIDEKFDLLIVNILYHDCFAGMFHKMGSPILFVASLPVPSHMTELLGTHLPSSFIPLPVLSDISAQLSFTQRTKNFLYNVHFSIMLDSWTRPTLEGIYRNRLGEKGLPSIKEIYRKQTSMILQNSHFALTSPRPHLPTIQEIGGIHCRPAKPLPKDLQEFADEAKDGFIVFSLGSIVKASHMPESVRLAFLNTFAKLKERVIWKWEKDEGMKDLPKNVKLVKWLPQQDLLGHPNIKLFITHGGLLSTEEAVYHGVPVVGTPVFIDQDANMKQAEILGFGAKVEILDLTEARLTPVVRRVLEDPRYSQKAKELSEIFRDQPETSLERAVFWTEYVMRHKGAYHLRSAGMDLNFFQYHCIDVIAFLVGIAATLLLFVYYVLKLIVGVTLWVTKGSSAKVVLRKSKRRGMAAISKKKKQY